MLEQHITHVYRTPIAIVHNHAKRSWNCQKKKKKILNSIKGKCLLSLASKSDNVHYGSAVGVCRLFVHGVHTMEMQSLPHVFLPFPKQPELSCICLHKIQVVWNVCDPFIPRQLWILSSPEPKVVLRVSISLLTIYTSTWCV